MEIMQQIKIGEALLWVSCLLHEVTQLVGKLQSALERLKVIEK